MAYASWVPRWFKFAVMDSQRQSERERRLQSVLSAFVGVAGWEYRQWYVGQHGKLPPPDDCLAYPHGYEEYIRSIR